MAHLWMKTPDGWTPLPLATDTMIWDAGATPVARSCPATERLTGQIALHRLSGPEEHWILLAPPRAAWVNDEPVLVGARLLRDRDELRLKGAGPVFFATERLARVVPFAGETRPVACARCRQVIAPGSPAVRCPQCGIWHHAGGDRACWTYAPTCSMCDQRTALDAGYRWSPEEDAA